MWASQGTFDGKLLGVHNSHHMGQHQNSSQHCSFFLLLTMFFFSIARSSFDMASEASTSILPSLDE
jgi:hypothetical protein